MKVCFLNFFLLFSLGKIGCQVEHYSDDEYQQTNPFSQQKYHLRVHKKNLAENILAITIDEPCTPVVFDNEKRKVLNYLKVIKN